MQKLGAISFLGREAKFTQTSFQERGHLIIVVGDVHAQFVKKLGDISHLGGINPRTQVY